MHEKVLSLMSEMKEGDVNKFIVSFDTDTNKMEVILGFKDEAEISKDEAMELGTLIFDAEFGFIPSEVFVSDDGRIHATSEIVQIFHQTTMQ